MCGNDDLLETFIEKVCSACPFIPNDEICILIEARKECTHCRRIQNLLTDIEKIYIALQELFFSMENGPIRLSDLGIEPEEE